MTFLLSREQKKEKREGVANVNEVGKRKNGKTKALLSDKRRLNY